MVLEGYVISLVLFLTTCIVIMVGGILAERGTVKPTVRRIRGIQSIEDSIDRCKEMGKPILYCGLNYGIRSSENVASLNILGHVARRAASVDVPLYVGVNYSDTIAPIMDVCETAAREVGKPEAYDPKRVMWWSDEFVAYTHGMTGLVSEIQPAAFFDFGYIQDENIVLPVYMLSQGIECFCMAGCRQIQYTTVTLIGTDDWLLSEELYAAAAYVSGTKEAAGSIWSNDWMKLLAWALVIIGAVVTLAGSTAFVDLMAM